MRAVVYARVSSLAQKERETIASQLSTLPAFIRERGWELVRPADTYVDDGRTAKAGHLEKRDGFTRLLADAAAGAFDVVVVVDQDRLTRSEDLTERGAVLGAFQRAGVKIAISSSGQVLDLGSSMGDLLSTLQGFFSAEENRKRRDRTTRGKLTAISRGRKPSGPTPFGYAYDKVTGVWSPDPVMAPIVLEIYQRVARGDSCEDIASDLHDRGIARPRSGTWSRERVWQLATARTYLGTWVADKARNLTMPVPVLVDERLWETANVALRSWNRHGRSRSRHVYLVEAIGRCALCEARIGISTHSDLRRLGRVRAAYYVCSRRRRPRYHDGERCQLPMRRVDEVDARLWAAVSELLLRPDHLERVIARRQTRDAPNWTDDLRGYQQRLERLERAEAVILGQYRRGRVSEAAMASELEASARERGMLERQIDAARRGARFEDQQRADVAALLLTAERLRAKLDTSSPEARRDLVRVLIPGTGLHVVTLGPRSIEASAILAPAPSAACTARKAGCNTVTSATGEPFVIRVVA